MKDSEMYPSESMSIADKMLNDCLNAGLGFTESISLSNLFIDEEVKRLKNLIGTTPANSHFFLLQVQKLELASKYLTLKL